MENLNIWILLVIFIIGSIIGYIVEMLWCYFKRGYFESRKSSIYGYYIPIYGLGAMIFTLLLAKISHWNAILIFIICAIVGSLFEALCSYIQEKAFGTVSWQYENKPFNLGGRTSAMYGIYWGVLGLIFIRSTYPFIVEIINYIPINLLYISVIITISFMIFDFTISSIALFRQKKRHQTTKAVSKINKFERWLDNNFSDKVLKKVYPNMIRKKY